MKPDNFCMYPCRGVLHTPRNILRRRFKPRTGLVFGASMCGNMKPAKFCTHPCRGVLYTPPKRSYAEGLGLKPAKFCTYPCRGVLHTPRKIPRQGFAPKTVRAFGVFGCGIVKLDEFCTYPCRGAKAYAPKQSSPKVCV